MTDINPGLYDELVTELLERRLSGLAARRLKKTVEGVDAAELPERLAELAGRWIHQAIVAVGSEQRAGAAVGLADAVLEAIARLEAGAPAGQRLVQPVRRLAAVEPLAPTGAPISIHRPLTPLRDTVLMTNARDQPAVGREIAAEIDSADQIDVVLAFIRWTGIRHFLAVLDRHVQRGRRLRIITTTYTGSTELRALQALVELGAEVKVSYDLSTTRLHAKAWRFQRDSGLSTVYIGSSNLTFSAQVTGLEWNVRASERSNPELIAAFDRTFATYWADPHFEPFDASVFGQAVAAARGRLADDPILTPFLSRTRSSARSSSDWQSNDSGDITTTSSSPPRGPARRSSPPWTTGSYGSNSTGRACCSSPTAARSWTRAARRFVTSCVTAPSASDGSAASVRPAGTTCSPRSRASPPAMSPTSSGSTSTWSSSTSSTTRRLPATRRCSTTCGPATSSA
jgi:HKD family nuclease